MLQNSQFCGTMFENTTKRFNKIVQSPLSLVVFGQGFNVGEHDMSKLIDLKGQKFGRLTVVKRVGSSKSKHAMWLCKCVCGNETVVNSSNLKQGIIKSCGCLKREILNSNNTKHGLSKTRLYRIWKRIKTRCYNSQSKDYRYYGAIGIKVCDEWINDFQSFYNWAMVNGYTDKLTIDRIDFNGNYEPSNCRWITLAEQQSNKKNVNIISYNGENHNLVEWSQILNMNYHTLYSRLYLLNYPIDKVFAEDIKNG